MRNNKVNLKLATLFALCASTCGGFGQSNAFSPATFLSLCESPRSEDVYGNLEGRRLEALARLLPKMSAFTFIR
jgi:hypothetical protein